MGKKRGFTLVELLVVISIIGLLSSVVLSALTTARAKARDTQRIQALGEMRKALLLYYDANGRYPVSSISGEYGTTGGSASSYWSTHSVWQTGGWLANQLAPYISQLPADPTNNAVSYNGIYQGTSYGYGYRVLLNGSDYDLIVRFETSNPLRCGVKNYISHAGSNNLGSNIGASWCNPETAGAWPASPIGATQFLYSISP